MCGRVFVAVPIQPLCPRCHTPTGSHAYSCCLDCRGYDALACSWSIDRIALARCTVCGSSRDRSIILLHGSNRGQLVVCCHVRLADTVLRQTCALWQRRQLDKSSPSRCRFCQAGSRLTGRKPLCTLSQPPRYAWCRGCIFQTAEQGPLEQPSERGCQGEGCISRLAKPIG